MKTYKKYFALFAVLFLVLFAGCSSEKAEQAKKVRNIILMIADGMSPAGFDMAHQYSLAVLGKELAMKGVIDEGNLGMLFTKPLGNLVTDSAASATAMATGEETLIRRISVSKDGKRLCTILEMAQKKKKAVGLVTTTDISDATPAAFGSHVASRGERTKIIDQYLKKRIDVLMGGGIRYWIPQGTKAGDFSAVSNSAGSDEPSEREDKKNMIKKAKKKGYIFVSDKKELEKASDKKRLVGLFSSSNFPFVLDRQESDNTGVPGLDLMTEKALKILNRKKKGFFLMVEGGRIDHAGHNNDAASLMAEILEFDRAVEIALQFCKKDKNTLLLITSDHSTGGPGIAYVYTERDGYDFGDAEDLKSLSQQDASFERIWAGFRNEPTTVHIRETVKKHTGIEITEEEAGLIKNPKPLTPFHVSGYKEKERFYASHTLGRVLNAKSNITWSTGNHLSAPVMLIGYGRHSERVRGMHKNRFVFDVMKEAFGF